jgi:hypothetical protein
MVGINDQTTTIYYQEQSGIISRHEIRAQTYSNQVRDTALSHMLIDG